jgi:hypothetical protein
MLEGKTPFGGEKMDEMRLYQKITEFKGNLEFPSHFSAEAPSARPRTRRAVLRLLVAVRCARCSVRDLARPKPKPCDVAVDGQSLLLWRSQAADLISKLLTPEPLQARHPTACQIDRSNQRAPSRSIHSRPLGAFRFRLSVGNRRTVCGRPPFGA